MGPDCAPYRRKFIGEGMMTGVGMDRIFLHGCKNVLIKTNDNVYKKIKEFNENNDRC